MMNRKPSQLWVIGKYILLLLVIYLSSAFVAPYKQKLIQLAPASLKPTIEALVPEGLPEIEAKAIESEKKQEVSKIDSVAVTQHSTLTQLDKLPESPWLIKRNDTLFWAISPLSTLDDINKVQQEVKKMGSKLAVNLIKFDSRQQFISSLTMNHESKKGTMGLSGQAGGLDPDAPIHGVTGYVTKDNLLFTETIAELKSALKKDRQRAMTMYIESISHYLTKSVYKEFEDRKIDFEKSVYHIEALSSFPTDSILSKKGIGKTAENTLFFSSANEKADFYINFRKTSFEEANRLSLKQVKLVHELIVKNTNSKSYFVFVNESPTHE